MSHLIVDAEETLFVLKNIFLLKRTIFNFEKQIFYFFAKECPFNNVP